MSGDAARRDASASGLNVLFVGAYDSTNYSYVELIRELTSRGHTCTVVVENIHDVINNKMFLSAGIPMVSEPEYALTNLDTVDFVFTGPFVQRQSKALFGALHEKRKFLVSFANLFSSVTMRNAPDLVIASSEIKFTEFAENGLRYNMVAVGNPQYDPLITARSTRPRVKLEEIRKVLVVDQGAYPLGELGKAQLGKTLISIAKNNPQMTFVIKPRYLPNEDGAHLHSVSDHLYGHLDDAPDNMTLMQEPTILEDIILDYDAMITTWSTAHLDAAALGMPLLLIDGLNSVDVFDVRKQRVAAAYEHLRDTGCLHDRRALETGPCPFNYVSDEYVRQEFYDASTPCAPRIADVLERVKVVVQDPGRAFSRHFQLPFAEFMAQVENLEMLPDDSDENRLNRRLFRRLNGVAQALAYDNRCLGYKLDMTEILGFWDRRLGADATGAHVAAVVREARDAGLRMKADYFESHPETVASDPFVQDYYFNWLFRNREYEGLINYAGPVAAPASLEYYKGKACLKKGMRIKAARHYVESFSISLQEPCRVLRKDRNIRLLLSQADSHLLAHAILFFLNYFRKYDALSDIDVPAREGFETLVYYRMRALVAKQQGDDAMALYEEYTTAAQGKTSVVRGRKLERVGLKVVVGWYRFRLRLYAAWLRRSQRL